jgi:hypothetical protein
MSASPLQIGYIDKPLASAEWPRLRSMLDPAMCRGNLDWSDIERDLAADTMQLVAIRKAGDPDLLACAVIRSAVTREGEALEIVAASGREYRTWAAWGMAALREAARLSGMIGVQFGGRKGWSRVFGQRPDASGTMRIAA